MSIQYNLTANAGQYTEPVSIISNTKVTATNGYIEWAPNSLEDYKNNVVVWQTWPVGADGGSAISLNEMIVRLVGVSAGASAVIDQGNNTSVTFGPTPLNAYWLVGASMYGIDGGVLAAGLNEAQIANGATGGVGSADDGEKTTFPDGSVRKAIYGGIRAIIIGDSRVQFNVDQTNTAITQRPRWFTFMNALLGQRFELVNNAGVAGETAQQVLNRVLNSNYGVGFGVNGSVSVTPTSNPGIGFDCEYVFLNVGTNDIFGASATAAATYAITEQICDIIRKTGKVLVLSSVIAPNSSLSGYSNAKAAELVKYNQLLQKYSSENDGVYFVDTFGSVVSPSSAVIETPAGYLYDSNHENNLGGYLEAKAYVSVLSGIVPARTGLLASSNAATSALDASIPQLQQNPLNTGTAAITATGYSGTTANNQLANANFVRGGGATAVLSSVTRPDGYGQNIKFACTFTANGDSLELRGNSYHAQVAAGENYFAACEVKYTGPSGADLVAANNLKGVYLSIQATVGGTNYFVQDMFIASSDVAMIASNTLVLKTPILTIPAGSVTVFRMNVTIIGAGVSTGSPEVEIGRMAIWKVIE